MIDGSNFTRNGWMGWHKRNDNETNKKKRFKEEEWRHNFVRQSKLVFCMCEC